MVPGCLIGPSGSADAQAAIPELARLSTLACTASATLPNLTVGDATQSLFRTVVSDDILTAWLSEQITERRDTRLPRSGVEGGDRRPFRRLRPVGRQRSGREPASDGLRAGGHRLQPIVGAVQRHCSASRRRRRRASRSSSRTKRVRA